VSVVRIGPGTIRGRVAAPASKSYTHRALVLGHLARRRFTVRNPLDSDDTRRTAAGLGALGSRVRRRRRQWVVEGGRELSRRRRSIDCGESGTTLRFLTAVAARQSVPVRLAGSARLGERPMAALLDALRGLGVSVHARASGFPIEVRGPLNGGRIRLNASTSSQFVSALLLVLPTLEEDSELHLTGTVVSAPYIDATLAVVRHHGIRVVRSGRDFRIPGGQRFQGSEFLVPGDASSAAYLWAAAAVGGGRIRVSGLPARWPQADFAILSVLRQYGARVERDGDAVTVASGTRRAFSVDLTDAPDLYPLAGVLAATAQGSSRLRGAPHIVHKESDRRAGTVRLARALGARARESPGMLAIEGTETARALDLTDLTDHRLVMSAAVGALAAKEPSRIGDAAAVGKSFPGFWTTLARVGAGVGRP
jgi:3-phosphoshikimate 1-carboxyvinyltransferase